MSKKRKKKKIAKKEGIDEMIQNINGFYWFDEEKKDYVKVTAAKIPDVNRLSKGDKE